MGLYKDEAPLLSSSAAVDEGLGIETSNGSKIMGSWAEVFQAPIATAAVNQSFFIAPYPVEVVGASAAWAVNSTSGNLMFEKTPGTTAVGSGNNLLTAVINSAGANNTVTTGTLVTTSGFLQLAKGDRLSAVFQGTETGLVGLVASVQLKRI
jgi:hypothetical protein